MEPDKKSVLEYFQSLQDSVSKLLITEDSEIQIKEDRWNRPNGGGGCSRILEKGKYIERAGGNFSHVKGDTLPASASVRRPELAGRPYEAMGVSIIIHPSNPYVPTSHANVRFFLSSKDDGSPVWWFGGGFDLTPYYGFEEDAVHWHRTAKAACDPFDSRLYQKYKEWCDDYFYLKHRKEARGIGGLFFDDVNEGGFRRCFDLVQSVGDCYLVAYQPILAKRKNEHFGERERNFQLYRRGRYVEFNLVYDRGTLFGLQSGGRTESILVSMPPVVNWEYDWKPEPGSKEEELYKKFLPPTKWVEY